MFVIVEENDFVNNSDESYVFIDSNLYETYTLAEDAAIELLSKYPVKNLLIVELRPSSRVSAEVMVSAYPYVPHP